MSIVYLDIETDGLDPFTCHVVTIQMLTADGVFILLQDPTKEDVTDFAEALENSLVVGQNLKFDSKFLKYHYGITLHNVYDTYIAELVLSGGLLAGRKGAALKDLALKYCGKYMDKSAQLSFKLGQELTDEQIEYAKNDLAYLPEIMKQQVEKIKTEHLESVINTEMKAIPAVVWLELSGIFIDMEKVENIRKQANADLKEASEFLTNELTEETTQATLFGGFERTKVNLDSPVELLNALRKKGFSLNSTSELDLSKYGTDPIVKAVLKHREASKMLSTFVDVLPNRRHTATGRVHADFNQFGAKSGRFTCRNPNLQQQPKSYDWRDIFRAEPGNVFVTSDYSQIELRIIGQVSNDAEFIRAYTEGEDLHKLTASKVFGVPLEEVTKQQRSIAKTVNFGIAYGMGAGGLKGNLQKVGIEISDEEAQRVVGGFNRAYPDVYRHLQAQSQKGLQKLQIRNAAGRLFKFEEPHDGKEEGRVKRESKNLPIQSLCADMVKDALAVLFLRLEPMGVKFVNTVHDELVFECKKEQAEEVKAIVKEEMEKAGRKYLTSMPCIAEVTISEVWEKD
jgi:DNA polymerase I-like protein with 3'-5' exonuclease and polymerase domains